MFEERKRDMMAKKLPGDMPYIKPGDENSKFYSKPDEPPVSHPAEVLERLQKEKPDAPIAELVKEADQIVAAEIEQRRLEKLAQFAAIPETPEKEEKEESPEKEE